MTFQGSVIKEQGVTFGIAVVKKHVIDSPGQARDALRGFSAAFGGIPTVLMAQDSSGRAYWYGRTDIVNYMRNVPISAIPWKSYNLN